MTRSREAIYTLLTNEPYPLSASDAWRLLHGQFDQATVYRTLHYLEGKGMADSFVLHCSEHGTERYYTIRKDSHVHRHWFHCQSCHRFTDLGDCRLTALLTGFEKETGVKITEHTLNLTGLCKECQRES